MLWMLVICFSIHSVTNGTKPRGNDISPSLSPAYHFSGISHSHPRLIATWNVIVDRLVLVARQLFSPSNLPVNICLFYS